MHGQIALGAVCCLVNIAIHAAIMAWVVTAARRAASAAAKLSAAPRLTAIMIATVLVLLVAHALEVLVWALTYRLVDLASISPSSTTRRWAMATSCPRRSGACSARSLH
jgi:hypothetical protein